MKSMQHIEIKIPILKSICRRNNLLISVVLLKTVGAKVFDECQNSKNTFYDLNTYNVICFSKSFPIFRLQKPSFLLKRES